MDEKLNIGWNDTDGCKKEMTLIVDRVIRIYDKVSLKRNRNVNKGIKLIAEIIQKNG